uniref:DUF3951 domain-containing protein n=1 Tax=Bacillus aquiflavi TaxID=2672567 RepID=UPI002867E37D|nr:DUF3951 domain-containing protein [Bacillus aquiflavi]
MISILFPTIITIFFGMVIFNILVKKKSIVNYYTPFDHITGQSTVEFHEEKEEKEEQNKQGDL